MKDNLKVLFNTWNAAFFIKGGGEVQLLKSKEGLEDLGCEIALYDMWSPQEDFQIFHQFSSVPGVEYVVEAYKKMGKKIAISPIYWDNLTDESPFFNHYKKLFSLTDILFTNSDSESEQIGRIYNIPSEKFIKTRNSISDEYFTLGNKNIFREKFKIEGDFILSVSNIDERKNTKRLLLACEKLNIPLVVVGAVRHDHYFAEFKNHPLLRFLGPVTCVETLKSAYQSCKIFALPSMCETPGIAALEAASQGAKIVITKEGPTKEYFKELVTFVDPWDINDITDGISKEIEMVRGKDLQSLVLKEYTWSKTAKDIFSGYLRLI